MSSKSDKARLSNEAILNELRIRASGRLSKNEEALTTELDQHDNLAQAIEELRIYHAEIEIQNDELQRAFNTAEESKTHYSQLFNENPLPSIVLDKQGVIQELNKAAMAELQLHYPATRKYSLYGYLDDNSSAIISRYLTHSSNQPSQKFELTLSQPTQNVFDCVFSEFTKENNTYFLLILKGVKELNDLKEQNELLSKAASETSSGIVITDESRKVIWANRAFTNISGYTLPEVAGKSLGPMLQGKKTNSNTSSEIKRALQNGKSVDVEILNYHKSGEPYWNSLKVSPIYQDGELRYFVGIQHDITKQKEQFEMILRMQRLDMIGHMSAGIAHDFNNILGVISGNCEVAAMVNQTPKVSQYLDKVKKAVDRASALTSKLLQSSKASPIETGKGPIDEVLSDIRELSTEIIPNNVSIEYQVSQDVQVIVSQGELHDVLLNLMLNAKNAIQHHGRIRFLLNNVTDYNTDNDHEIAQPKWSESYDVISIEDTGCGIPEDKLDSIFIPFETYSNKDGTGLGLAMVLGFVHRQGYGLTIHSRVGEGTKISIWIPHINVKDSELPSKYHKQKTKNQHLKIIIVDDEVELLSSTKALLELEGHEVVTFDDPHDAMNLINDANRLEGFSLVITDEIMPGDIQGHDIMKALKDRKPAILVSGFSAAHNVDEFKESMLSKPFNRVALNTKIDAVLTDFHKDL